MALKLANRTNLTMHFKWLLLAPFACIAAFRHYYLVANLLFVQTDVLEVLCLSFDQICVVRHIVIVHLQSTVIIIYSVLSKLRNLHND